MPTDIEQRCDTIEECYEFTLSYAARGQATEEGTDAGKQIRYHLNRALEAIAGLKAACFAEISAEPLAVRERYEAFLEVLGQDAQKSIAAVELVLAQPVISSQLIDNLNACIHLRALLTDLFLITEILQLRQRQASTAAPANAPD
ncbi:MAG TPA: hypothetical protein VGR47_18805 [Terracidiphilus sp.]|nr:hypothetical protein [Terracidiphilus sp.]